MQFTSPGAKRCNAHKAVTAIFVLSAYVTVSSLSAWPALCVKARTSEFEKDHARTNAREAARQTAREVLGQLPLSFEENRGQAPGGVQYFSHADGYRLFLKADEAVFEISGLEKAETRMKFVGANPSPNVRGVDHLAGKSNYFAGNDPKRWLTAVPHFARIRYENLYPGVDCVFYGSGRDVEYDFILAPGADYRAIALLFEGASGIRLDTSGDLILKTEAGELRQHRPFAYQEVNGRRKPVACAYKLLDNPLPSIQQAQIQYPKSRRDEVAPCAMKIENPAVVFELGDYDESLPLVIDPVLDFSTYLGGASIFSFSATGVALDAAENIYVVGHMNFLPVPASGGIEAQEFTNRPGIFVAKIDSVHKQLVYFTHLTDTPPFFSQYSSGGIAVDSAGNAYVIGSTATPNFPTTPGALQPALQGYQNAFVTKINPDGNALVYSTYLGATDDTTESGPVQCSTLSLSCTTTGFDIAVDPSGNAYVTGATSASSFPTTPNAFKPTKSRDDCTGASTLPRPCTEAFVSKLNAAGSALVYSTFLGGNGNDTAAGIALDASGNAYVIGTTEARDFPVRNALHEHFLGGASDAFLSKLSADGSTLLHSTYLGGSGSETGRGVALDKAGNIYLCGDTLSTDLPTTADAFQGEPSSAVAFKTTDGGATWRPLLKGLGGGFGIGGIAVDPINPANVFLSNFSGIYRSADGGERWEAPAGPRMDTLLFLAFAPQDPTVSFAKMYGPSGDVLMRTTDGGRTWGAISYPKLNVFYVTINDLRVDPSDVSTFYISDTSYDSVGRVLKTTDGGNTWALADQGLPLQSYPKILGIAPQNPALLFARAGALFRSKDGGEKWKPSSLTGAVIHHVSFDSSAPATVYASSGDKLFKSTDEGASWGVVESNLTSFDDILFAANTLYTVSSGKIVRSADGGKTWNDVGAPFRMPRASLLAVDPKNPATLYAVPGRTDTDAFVMKLGAQASAITYCTYLGGKGTEGSASIAVDDDGNSSITGTTYSADFPTRNAIQTRSLSSSEAFVARLDPTGAAIYSTYLGGNNSDSGNGIATDKAGRVYVVGSTYSNQFPQVASLQSFMGTASFITRIADSPSAHPAPGVTSVTPDSGASLGRTRITIRGANFLPGATVSIGDALAQDVTVVDANTIQATTASSYSGRLNVNVMNPDGQVGVLEKSFNYLLTPVIQHVVIQGNRLIVFGPFFFSYGAGFDDGAVILVDGREVKTDSPNSPSTLMSKKALKRIKPGQTVRIQVRNANGLVSEPFPYTRPQ